MVSHEVRLAPVSCVGSRVTFDWEMDPSDDYFRSTRFYIEYPDLDLNAVPMSTWCVLFFAQLAPGLDTTGRSYRFRFPAAVEMRELMPWVDAFRLSDRITIDPESVAPRTKRKLGMVNDSEPAREIGLLLGGGKDSMMALAALTELYGESVVPVMLGHHPRSAARHRARHQRQLFEPLAAAREGSRVYIECSVRNAFATRVGSRSSGLMLYFITLLPYIASGRFRSIFFCYEFTLLGVTDTPNGPVFAHYRARPEVTGPLAESLSEAYGYPLSIGNFSAGISKATAFEVLVRRYPEYLPLVFMCEATLETDVKWCTECWKCFEYVAMCLAFEAPCEIDLDAVFLESPYVQAILEQAPLLDTHPDTGNPVWSPIFGGATVHYATLCASMWAIDLEHAATVMGPESCARLAQMRRLLGNHRFEAFERYLPRSIEAALGPGAAELAQILDEFAEPVGDGEDVCFLDGDRWATLQIGRRYEPPRATFRPVRMGWGERWSRWRRGRTVDAPRGR